MSAEIVIIIVGTALMLLAIVDSLIAGESSGGLVNTKLRIPLGIIGILLVIYGGYSYGAVNLPAQIEQVQMGNKKQVKLPVDRVQVISPLEGDSVGCRMLTMGVYPSGHDKDIWVLLKPSDNRYYPQSDHTNTSYKRNGDWQVITRYGGDKGETFEVIIYEADTAASEYFSSTIQQWQEAKAYPGLELEEIPNGAQEVDRIQVSLRENCRGAHDDD